MTSNETQLSFTGPELLSLIEETLMGLHTHQLQRAAAQAQRIVPGLTAEDLLNPDTFPGVSQDPEFMFEHGQAAGVLAAKLALRACIIERMRETVR